MLLDLNFIIKGLDGNDLPLDANGPDGRMANRLMANAISRSGKLEKKYMRIAKRLYVDGKVELDKEEQKTLIVFLENPSGLTLLSKDPILEKLEALKE